MSQSDTEGKNASGVLVSGASNTRLTVSWLIIARIVWLVLVIPSLGVFLANLLAYDRQLQRVCAGPFLCNLTGALTARELQALSTNGFSVSGYAALLTISLALIVSVWCVVGFLLIPLSIGFSILRFRLYDIDVLINRTLVYGSLTALLALLYFGLIFGLQSLFQGMFHQDNKVAIVVSTLVIAALFQPLRRRLQAIIDRRFYRRKYDARRTIANFSATLRGEVDLTELSEQLVAVVEETMQPAHVSLWLRQPRKARFTGEEESLTV